MKGVSTMKKYLFRTICIVLCISLLSVFCSCSKVSPENCGEHIGESKCDKCGLNYFEELSNIIQDKATSVKEGSYMVDASSDSVDTSVKYDSNKNTVYIFLIYKADDNPIAVFLLTMKPTTGHKYGWALQTNNKMANGTFKAEDVTDLVFRPEITNNDFTTEEFSALNFYYEESVSFCIDILYSLLSSNTKNLKISNLGFKNYSPNLQI